MMLHPANCKAVAMVADQNVDEAKPIARVPLILLPNKYRRQPNNKSSCWVANEQSSDPTFLGQLGLATSFDYNDRYTDILL